MNSSESACGNSERAARLGQPCRASAGRLVACRARQLQCSLHRLQARERCHAALSKSKSRMLHERSRAPVCTPAPPGRPMLNIGCADAYVCVGSVLAKWRVNLPTLPRKMSKAVL